ncbi:MAG: putative DNA modification/repair radical SAM protein [Clostridia bacterium]|nr:putative DNA modification/repair radical SAM protein [Clostridia bacterium]
MDEKKLEILTEAAKFDVSCSSSGSRRKNTPGGLGNGAPGGICHSFTPDGRCVSLLKILLSNDCVYDCEYCPNRRSAETPRATATPEEICELTVAFYKRNYIEGLFLSSAVCSSPSKTAELLLETVKKLREDYNFHGYIHLKGIPSAEKEITEKCAGYADRMSFNIELPSQKSLTLLCPQKTMESIVEPMTLLRDRQLSDKENKVRQKDRAIPAGQTTQMIIGASPECDRQILNLTEALYRKMDLRRVYYSSYVPVVESALLPDKGAGLLREHRLYQADWLIRFYGFDVAELLDEGENLSEEYDPKCAWALKHMELFPVEVNRAPVEMLLRVPGIGQKSAYKICSARKYASLTYEDLGRMKVVLKRAKHFITCGGKFFGDERISSVKKLLSNEERLEESEQLSLFSDAETRLSATEGEL